MAKRPHKRSKAKRDPKSQKKPLCAARNNRGEPCRMAPIPGGTVCRYHGGAAPQVKEAAERRLQEAEAKEVVRTFGLPQRITPHEALIQEVWRTAGHVHWLGEIVGRLEEQTVIHGVTKTVQMPDGSQRVEARAALNVWVKVYQDERDRLARVSEAAIRVGVAERQVRIAERQAELISATIRRILVRAGLDPMDPEVRAIVRAELVAAAGGNGDNGPANL